MQIGISSSGLNEELESGVENCGNGAPQIFTNVSHYKDWIDNTINDYEVAN